MQVLRNAIVLLDIPTQLEFAIIGGVILIGVGAEEVLRSLTNRRITT
jgi:ribose transport system permease protein